MKRKQGPPLQTVVSSRLSGSRQSLHSISSSASTDHVATNPSPISASQVITSEVGNLVACLSDLDLLFPSPGAVKVFDLDSLDLRVQLEPLRAIPHNLMVPLLPPDFAATDLVSTFCAAYSVFTFKFL